MGKAGKVLIMQGHAEVERLQQLGVILDSGTPTAEQNLIKLEAGRGRFFYHRDSFLRAVPTHRKIIRISDCYQSYLTPARRILRVEKWFPKK
jgi:hypothetical protein